MNKLLFALSLAKKSGKLIYGFDQVVENTRKGVVQLVILAADSSSKTQERVKYQIGDTPIYISALTQYDFSQVCGRLAGVLAIADENLAKLAQNAISETEGE